jgi:hypothetical protein
MPTAPLTLNFNLTALIQLQRLYSIQQELRTENSERDGRSLFDCTIAAFAWRLSEHHEKYLTKQQNRRNAGLDSNLAFPEYKPRALPLHQQLGAIYSYSPEEIKTRKTLFTTVHFIHFPVGSHLEHRAAFEVSVITHIQLDTR